MPAHTVSPDPPPVVPIDTIIPHTVAPRRDTAINNVKLGMWLFLASEIMLFGALLAAYVMLRAGADHWPRGAAYLDVPWAAVNTIILIGSSLAIARARASCARQRFGAFRRWMVATVLGGGTFLVIKGLEYASKLSSGHGPESNNFLAIYFTLTGLHVLHLIGGMVVNGYLLGPGATMWHTEHARFTNRVETAGLYWHFVDAVWIVLFVVLYLL